LKRYPYILTITFLVTACNQNNSAGNDRKQTGTLNSINLPDTSKPNQKQELAKKISFKDVSEIVADGSYSTWVELQDSSASLALHFQDKDTLDVSYSAECWIMYPYKLDGNKIVVYWDNNIDTKYNFDIVKAINKTDKKLIGKPFMILELINDTTLKATYPMKDLIRKINSSSKERTFFPDKYVVAQDGYL
jgi:hypothetical protein